MYRTDKQFMRNPATASSRIYIGALNKTILADDLEAKFKVHGKILGLSLNSGFAFIQFDQDFEAQAAIKAENGAYMQGRKIIVKQAISDNKTGGGAPQGGPQQRGPPMRQQEPPSQGQPAPKSLMEAPGPPSIQQSKVPQTPPAPSVQKSEQSKMDSKLSFVPPDKEEQDTPMDEEMDTGPNIKPPPPQNFSGDDRGRTGQRTRGNRGGRKLSKPNDRFDDGPGGFQDRPPFFGRGPRGGGGGDFMHERYVPPHVDGPPLAPVPDRNDCEIIVVSRALTEYAEYVESRLKQQGLIVDLLFPNEDVPIGRVLANISSRGCLYAILVMPQNEEHRSITLNILHGISQEHRNMPIDDALLLLARNFEAYMRGQNLQPEDPTKISLSDRHPVPIQMLFNLLAENRQLSSGQYDRILKYLEERRELQHEFEVAEGINQDSNESTTKQTELQNRIMNILNKSDEPVIPQSITAPTPPTKDSSSTPTPLLKDPTVQKALDSLLTGDMFKNIAGAM